MQLSGAGIGQDTQIYLETDTHIWKMCVCGYMETDRQGRSDSADPSRQRKGMK